MTDQAREGKILPVFSDQSWFGHSQARLVMGNQLRRQEGHAYNNVHSTVKIHFYTTT
jgi:hypothetical protein